MKGALIVCALLLACGCAAGQEGAPFRLLRSIATAGPNAAGSEVAASADSADACQGVCASTPTCAAYVYTASAGCSLKACVHRTSLVADSGAVTGVREDRNGWCADAREKVGSLDVARRLQAGKKPPAPSPKPNPKPNPKPAPSPKPAPNPKPAPRPAGRAAPPPPVDVNNLGGFTLAILLDETRYSAQDLVSNPPINCDLSTNTVLGLFNDTNAAYMYSGLNRNNVYCTVRTSPGSLGLLIETVAISPEAAVEVGRRLGATTAAFVTATGIPCGSRVQLDAGSLTMPQPKLLRTWRCGEPQPPNVFGLPRLCCA